MQRIFTTALTALSLCFFTACEGGSGHDEHGHDGPAEHSAFEEVSKAVCVLSATGNEELPNVAGTVTFTQTKSGVLVEANITGLKPDSKHGFHVHQWGDVSAADGTGTGGHYNPGGGEHSLPKIDPHEDHSHATTGGHAGDFGNLESDADGNATLSHNFENISLTGDNAILGRGIIVHLGEDDGTGASGNAGPRVAQGVIGIANPE